MDTEPRSSMWDRMVTPSTRAYWREAKKRDNSSFFENLHGYIYLRWPYFYISLGLGRHPLTKFLKKPLYYLGKLFGLWKKDGGKSFADTYHAKVMPPEKAKRLITIGRQVDTVIPEKVLPYAKARDIVLEHPDDIVLFKCPCRSSMSSPCFPLEVCLIVGKPFTDFILEHHPGKSQRLTVEQAVKVLHDCHMRGNVSHAFFKEAVFGRYYAICNCCSCCCGAMQAQLMGVPMLTSSGYVAEVDVHKCTGCGKCAKKCHFKAIKMGQATVGESAEKPSESGTGAGQAPGQGVVAFDAGGQVISPVSDKECAESAVRADVGAEIQADAPAEPPKRARVQRVPIIDAEKCMGCGICAVQCRTGALGLKLDPAKPSPMEI